MGASSDRLRARRGGAVLALLVDLFRDAWTNRAWAVLSIAILTFVAVALGTAGHATVPFLIYGGL